MHVQPPMGERAPFESINPFLCLADSDGSIIAPLWTLNCGFKTLGTIAHCHFKRNFDQGPP